MRDVPMFRDKPYHAVNREERYYCAILFHLLLASPAMRQRFVDALPGGDLDPGDLEVYVEAAALRDYWHDLSEDDVYTPATHERRRAVLETILSHVDLPPELLDQHEVFWTTPQRTKYWSPGRWAVGDIRAQVKDEVVANTLVGLRHAFNAKPDFLLASSGRAVLVEAKLESGEGQAEGYAQYQTQQLIAELLQLLVPRYSQHEIPVYVLALHRTGDDVTVTWAEILGMTSDLELDDHTSASLERLGAYYH